jgi:FkbM family methyltransferase
MTVAGMVRIEGLWWPADVGDRWRYSLRHVGSLDWAIAHCRRKRTAVQAGGNIGLWPRRMAVEFSRVITFEPDLISRECLERNVPHAVEVRPEALGDRPGRCALKRKSLGSHHVIPGDVVSVLTVDSLNLADLDLLQLDLEGYEWHALAGARETLLRCQPIVQVEIRRFTERYGQTAIGLRQLLADCGYRLVSTQPGSDFVFEYHR